MINNVGIIGCGKIFPRHVEAIEKNKDFNLISICDIDRNKLNLAKKNINCDTFTDYKKMISKSNINFVVIATPNSQHFSQAMYCLKNGCDILIEKPATLNPDLIKTILDEAKKNNQKAFCVLQVRLNSCIQNLKYLIDNNIIGNIRGISLIQRWQRPIEYFSDWRGNPNIGGGILHECGIHYLDILCYLFGVPKVRASIKYNTKHKNVEIEDTIYSIIDYGSFGGNIEVNISSEPKNLECSLSILTEKGYIKLGGKAMNEVKELSFEKKEDQAKINEIMKLNNTIGSPNSYGSYSGSCPNHPELYKNIKDFNLKQSQAVLNLISEIYKACGVEYKSEKK